MLPLLITQQNETITANMLNRCVLSSFRRIPGLPGPDPGDFLYAQKVTKKAPGTPRTPICLIGWYQDRYRAATEILPGRWPLVIGAVGIPLRLTALGLIGVSCRTKIDTSIPSKGRQPKPDKISAAD